MTDLNKVVRSYIKNNEHLRNKNVVFSTHRLKLKPNNESFSWDQTSPMSCRSSGPHYHRLVNSSSSWSVHQVPLSASPRHAEVTITKGGVTGLESIMHLPIPDGGNIQTPGCSRGTDLKDPVTVTATHNVDVPPESVLCVTTETVWKEFSGHFWCEANLSGKVLFESDEHGKPKFHDEQLSTIVGDLQDFGIIDDQDTTVRGRTVHRIVEGDVLIRKNIQHNVKIEDDY